MYDYREYNPGKNLSGIIDCFWVMKKQGNMTIHEDIIIPNACGEIVIASGNGYKRINPINGELEHIKGTYILGQRSKFFLLKELQDGSTDIGIRFKPFGLSEIGIDVKNMSNQIVKFSDLFDVDICFLNQISNIKKDNNDNLYVLEQFLEKNLKEKKSDKYLIKKAVHIIHKAKGIITVKELQEELYTSKSTMSRTFKQDTGFSPKEFINVWRFNYIVTEKMNKKSNMLTSLALDFGFFDQAHFIKYFKKYTGESPRNYFRSKSYLSKIMSVEVSTRNMYYT